MCAILTVGCKDKAYLFKLYKIIIKDRLFVHKMLKYVKHYNFFIHGQMTTANIFVILNIFISSSRLVLMVLTLLESDLKCKIV